MRVADDELSPAAKPDLDFHDDGDLNVECA